MDEIAKKLGQKEFKEFLTALSDETITSAAIERALAKRGVKCTGNTIIKFRRMANVSK
jgi:3-methyladenine DNA glycosylase Tag